MNPPILRDYQQRTIDELRVKFREGKRRILIVAPTGSGKTVAFAELARLYHTKSNAPVIAVAHRRELINQTVQKFADVGIEAGVVMADDKRTDPSALVNVCSIQTLINRMDRLPLAELVILDEAHHAASDSMQAIISAYPKALIVGCTATPWRTDGRGMADVFEDVVVSAKPKELIASGALVPIEQYLYDAPDLHGVKVTGGDFNQKQLQLATNTEILVSNVVDEYVKHGAGKRAILFPTGIDHSKNLCSQFRRAGVSAEHIDCHTPHDERQGALDSFGAGKTKILSSVGVLTEGWDSPAAEICILARSTKSMALYIQMVGRVLRPSPGKKHAIVHDHGGNIFRFGFVDDDREYSLSDSDCRTEKVMSCTDCGFVTKLWPPDGKCPKCGSMQDLPKEIRDASDKRRGKMPEKKVVDGKRLDREQIQKIIDEFKTIRPDMTPQMARKVKNATRQDKASEYLRLKAVAAKHGFKDGFVSHQYRASFGVWPKFSPGELEGVDPATKPFLPIISREGI
jgi:DNA repair protein RadD